MTNGSQYEHISGHFGWKFYWKAELYRKYGNVIFRNCYLIEKILSVFAVDLEKKLYERLNACVVVQNDELYLIAVKIEIF